MRTIKKILLSFLLIPAVLLSPMTAVANETSVSPYLMDMIDVRLSENSEENETHVNNIISRLNRIDPRILENVHASGVTLILSDLPMTEFPEFSNLKGVVPRGHTDTWDNIPGLGGFQSYVRVGASEPGIKNNHGDVNLELHEFGHIVDSFLVDGTTISNKEEFVQIHAEEHEKMFPGQPYFKYVEEYFAESFAYYYLSQDTRNILSSRAPKTAAFLENMHHKIFTITEVKSDGFSLSWDDYNGEYYNVIVNGSVVKTTQDLTAVVDGLEPSTLYEVAVEVRDKNDNVIDKTYVESIYTTAKADVDTDRLSALLVEVGKVSESNITPELREAKKEAASILQRIVNEDISQEEVDAATSNLSDAYQIFQPRIMEKNIQGEENTFTSETSHVKTMPKHTTWIVILSVSVVLLILAIVYLYYSGREED
ncbi:anthrax toxin lethal factor-related metalloendopeptidase [Nosocomiicoccus massiliensis]|uniref:anthrax toxin lethal factor-related metalloendopeptidase n=1 Tax=Nosocomiicoccus massiliensis TaxID=1232430 RepID=UPI0004219DBE|nr:hypothetical protein [Nosocomiicoccus massiliensis]